MSLLSRFLWGVSLLTLVIGILNRSTWLCSMAWLLLWIAAIGNDRRTRRAA